MVTSRKRVGRVSEFMKREMYSRSKKSNAPQKELGCVMCILTNRDDHVVWSENVRVSRPVVLRGESAGSIISNAKRSAYIPESERKTRMG